MTVKHTKSKRKITSGRLRKHRKIKRFELGREYVPARLSDSEKRRKVRTMGGNEKTVALNIKYVNVNDNGITKKVEIKNVVENPANPHFVRRNIITKGSILETELGKVIVTSRPGQNGIVSAKLLK